MSCFNKIQNGLSFWYRPTQVVLEKGCLFDFVVVVVVIWVCRIVLGCYYTACTASVVNEILCVRAELTSSAVAYFFSNGYVGTAVQVQPIYYNSC